MNSHVKCHLTTKNGKTTFEGCGATVSAALEAALERARKGNKKKDPKIEHFDVAYTNYGRHAGRQR